jgi:hypothetical protein
MAERSMVCAGHKEMRTSNPDAAKHDLAAARAKRCRNKERSRNWLANVRSPPESKIACANFQPEALHSRKKQTHTGRLHGAMWVRDHTRFLPPLTAR